MPFIDRIVQHINETLKGGSLNDARFATARWVGITTLLTRKKGTDMEIMPAFEKDGEYKTLEPDDRNALLLYHKISAGTYATVQKSRGDGYDLKHVQELTLVVCADEQKVRLRAEQLEPLVIFGMPQRISQELLAETGIINCLITPMGSDLDKLRVFRAEYPQSEFFLKPFHQLFSIRYRVETTFSQKCIDTCLCGA